MNQKVLRENMFIYLKVDIGLYFNVVTLVLVLKNTVESSSIKNTSLSIYYIMTVSPSSGWKLVHPLTVI